MKELHFPAADLTACETELQGGHDVTRIGGYIRVGCDGPETEQKIREYQDRIRDYCAEEFGGNCQFIWAVDRGVSGLMPYKRRENDSDNYRKGLTFLIQLIERNLIDCVCTYSLNQLSRSIPLWVHFHEDYLKRYGVEFRSVMEPIHKMDSATQLLVHLTNHHGICYTTARGNAVSYGIRRRLSEGYLIGRLPYGWQMQNRNELKLGEHAGIRPHPERAEVVHRMIERYMEGESPNQIAIHLEKSGIPSPTGKVNWNRSTVLRVVTNPVHFGLISHRDQLIRGAHYYSRIVDEALFQDVMNIRNQRRHEAAADE